jgi:hypothetical protein
VHEADQGDTVSLPVTLEAAMEQLTALDAAPTPEAPAELIADKLLYRRPWRLAQEIESIRWPAPFVIRQVPQAR